LKYAGIDWRIIYMDLQEGEGIWTGLIWLRIGTGGEPF
jgi:hypothetical protein